MAVWNCPSQAHVAYQTFTQVGDIFSNIYKGSNPPSKLMHRLDIESNKESMVDRSRLEEIMKIADNFNPGDFFSNKPSEKSSNSLKKTKKSKEKKSHHKKEKSSNQKIKHEKTKDKKTKKSSHQKTASSEKSKQPKKNVNSEDMKANSASLAELPKVGLKKKIVYLGTYTVNPQEYIQKYGDNLVHFSKHLDASSLEQTLVS